MLCVITDSFCSNFVLRPSARVRFDCCSSKRVDDMVLFGYDVREKRVAVSRKQFFLRLHARAHKRKFTELCKKKKVVMGCSLGAAAAFPEPAIAI